MPCGEGGRGVCNVVIAVPRSMCAYPMGAMWTVASVSVTTSATSSILATDWSVGAEANVHVCQSGGAALSQSCAVIVGRWRP